MENKENDKKKEPVIISWGTGALSDCYLKEGYVSCTSTSFAEDKDPEEKDDTEGTN